MTKLFFRDKSVPGDAAPKTEKPTAEQSTDTTKDQLGEPGSFIGVAYWSMGEVIFRSRMTHRQLHQQSPPQTG